LKSANAKLQSDKKVLEKRVTDLEEEIKTRCRNYMTMIEKLKRGEGVVINHVLEKNNSSSSQSAQK
jgi:guanylate kinase